MLSEFERGRDVQLALEVSRTPQRRGLLRAEIGLDSFFISTVPRDRGRLYVPGCKPPPPLTKHSTMKLQRNEHVSVVASLRCMCKPPITTLFILSQPILDGRKRQNAATVGNKLTASQRQNQSSLPRTAAANPTPLERQNLQPNSVTSLTRDSECGSILTEKDHIQGGITCQCHLTELSFV